MLVQLLLELLLLAIERLVVSGDPVARLAVAAERWPELLSLEHRDVFHALLHPKAVVADMVIGIFPDALGNVLGAGGLAGSLSPGVAHLFQAELPQIAGGHLREGP